MVYYIGLIMSSEEKFNSKMMNYEDLIESLKIGSAFRRVTKLAPAGGQGSKVYPPTFSQ